MGKSEDGTKGRTDFGGPSEINPKDDYTVLVNSRVR